MNKTLKGVLIVIGLLLIVIVFGIFIKDLNSDIQSDKYEIPIYMLGIKNLIMN